MEKRKMTPMTRDGGNLSKMCDKDVFRDREKSERLPPSPPFCGRRSLNTAKPPGPGALKRDLTAVSAGCFCLSFSFKTLAIASNISSCCSLGICSNLFCCAGVIR